MPAFTVVTPSYNQNAFIEETLRSVLDQASEVDGLEYIVVDGGSTDGSVDTIRRYADRLAWWVSEPDRGQADAINKGWARASGDVVSFLNSDDTLLPGALARVAAAFDAHPDAGVVYGQARWVTRDGAPILETRLDADGQAFLDVFLGVPQPAAFVRREVLDRVGLLDPSFHFGLDGDFFLRAIGTFRAVALPDVLATMRQHEDAKSVASSLRFVPDVMRIARQIVDAPERYPRFAVDPRRVMATAHQVAARFYFMDGAFGQAAAELARAVSARPAIAPRILTREVPKLAARAALGHERYIRLARSVQQRA